MSTLSVRNMSCQFGDVPVVRDVSFECREGITGLIGPNGAGKSTVLNAISGFTRPKSGDVRLDGVSLVRLPAHRIARRGLARTFQVANVFERLTVLENLLAGAPEAWRWGSIGSAVFRRGGWRRWQDDHVSKARELLALFELEHVERALAGELSGGQRRLVEIMRCLMRDPSVILLDEPMAGISPALALQIGDYLGELARGGLCMLMVEHELALVERLCSRVVVMVEGRVLMEGSMAEIRKDERVVEAYVG